METLFTIQCWQTRDIIHVLGFSHGRKVALAKALKVCIPYCLGNAVTISISLYLEHFLRITNQINVMYEPNMCTNVIMICGSQNQVVDKSNFLESIDWLKKYGPPWVCTYTLLTRTCNGEHQKGDFYFNGVWAKHLHPW